MISLGDRMKIYYENITRTSLTRRTPVIIRLDGKSFHTWTKWAAKPYDSNIAMMMIDTARFLVNEIQGAVVSYTQSDEISIFIRDYDTLETSMWFDGNIQKIVSVTSSMATACFNRLATPFNNEIPLAFFDARVFNIPKEEVCNYFIFRQQDVIRNSVQMLGQHFIGHKKIQGLNNEQVKDELTKQNIIVDAWPEHFKYGSAWLKGDKMYRGGSFIHNRDYINNLVYLPDDKLSTEENK